jgi:hypothetical protein
MEAPDEPLLWITLLIMLIRLAGSSFVMGQPAKS